jgi:hypothetical protein
MNREYTHTSEEDAEGRGRGGTRHEQTTKRSFRQPKDDQAGNSIPSGDGVPEEDRSDLDESVSETRRRGK